MERERSRFYDAEAEKASRVIGSQVTDVARAIERGENWTLEAATLLVFLRSLYTNVGRHFLGRVSTVLRTEPPGIDAWTARVLAYLDRVGAKKVRNINATTRDMIVSVTRDAVREGWGSAQTARELRKKWRDLSVWRSNKIARTEVISASNFGTQEGVRVYAQEEGLTAEKEWLPFIDGRERDDHREAAGQRVGVDDPFIVGGARLMFAGDSSLGAPAEQVINCRCTEIYHV